MALPQFQPVKPWNKPKKEDCLFYHTIDLPSGEHISGPWDIRDHFDSYIGQYAIKGKTLLDVGTASGYLSFEAEKVGAQVTSLDVQSSREILHIPHATDIFHTNRAQFIQSMDVYFQKLKNSYWYCWHNLNSRSEVIYAPLSDFPFWDRRFDVVLAGAIIEHISDPVTMIGNMAAVAQEAVVIAYTEVIETDELIMKCPDNWKRYSHETKYTWYVLSTGLYRQIFDNLGFDVEFRDAYAIAAFAGATSPAMRKTIVARRRMP